MPPTAIKKKARPKSKINSPTKKITSREGKGNVTQMEKPKSEQMKEDQVQTQTSSKTLMAVLDLPNMSDFMPETDADGKMLIKQDRGIGLLEAINQQIILAEKEAEAEKGIAFVSTQLEQFSKSLGEANKRELQRIQNLDPNNSSDLIELLTKKYKSRVLTDEEISPKLKNGLSEFLIKSKSLIHYSHAPGYLPYRKYYNMFMERLVIETIQKTPKSKQKKDELYKFFNDVIIEKIDYDTFYDRYLKRHILIELTSKIVNRLMKREKEGTITFKVENDVLSVEDGNRNCYLVDCYSFYEKYKDDYKFITNEKGRKPYVWFKPFNKKISLHIYVFSYLLQIFMKYYLDDVKLESGELRTKRLVYFYLSILTNLNHFTTVVANGRDNPMHWSLGYYFLLRSSLTPEYNYSSDKRENTGCTIHETVKKELRYWRYHASGSIDWEKDTSGSEIKVISDIDQFKGKVFCVNEKESFYVLKNQNRHVYEVSKTYGSSSSGEKKLGRDRLGDWLDTKFYKGIVPYNACAKYFHILDPINNITRLAITQDVIDYLLNSGFEGVNNIAGYDDRMLDHKNIRTKYFVFTGEDSKQYYIDINSLPRGKRKYNDIREEAYNPSSTKRKLYNPVLIKDLKSVTGQSYVYLKKLMINGEYKLIIEADGIQKEPWSAATISHLVGNSYTPALDRRQFFYSAGHTQYFFSSVLNKLFENITGFDDGYKAVSLLHEKPVIGVGDIFFKARPSKKNSASHSDIVYKIDRFRLSEDQDSKLFAVLSGGNTRDGTINNEDSRTNGYSRGFFATPRTASKAGNMFASDIMIELNDDGTVSETALKKGAYFVVLQYHKK